ncbi:MAG TPA: hypothetical protein VLT32_21455 [Candidatus Sulfomarinibacteraceae bacterium]|nr:hypothetical protein [Candidatus Sulfomarinibacteraceae bacterium]
MVRLLPSEPTAVAYGLGPVLENAFAGGAREPSFVAIADSSGRWLGEAAVLGPGIRARGVIAAVDDRAFVAALRLGVGGALRLPPSTVAAGEALAAAAGAPVPPTGYDPGVAVALASASPSLSVVSYSGLAFWRRQLGDRVLTERLLALAERLQLPAAVLPWPAMVIAAAGPELEAAWARLCAEGAALAPSLAVHVMAGPVGPDEVVAAAYRVLAAAPDGTGAEAAIPPQPVHELPSGRAVGYWSTVAGEVPAGAWLAVPAPSDADTTPWRLLGADDRTVIIEVLLADDLDHLAGAAAVRVPGWFVADLRPGTPAGLLVARLAEAANRRGLPLWVPNVDRDGLRFVLGLPGTLWVDGPSVPR